MRNMKMMSLLLAMLAGTFTFTACGGDDDDDNGGGSGEFNYNLTPSNLNTPKYEDNSACYVVGSSNSDIYSVEFTASGDYIIVPNYTYSYLKARKRSIMSKAVQMMTRSADYYNIIYGKYTVASDGTYVLEGYGTIKVNGEGGNAVSLDITPEGGETYTLQAAEKNQMADSELTNALCRTWSFASFRITMTIEGIGTVLDKEYRMNETRKLLEDLNNIDKKYSSLFDDEDEDDEYDDEYDDWSEEELGLDEMPQQMIFSKAGTYMVLYANSSLAVSTWSWRDESKGILRYSWDYTDTYSSGVSGNVQVGFRNNQLAITEVVTDKNYEYDEDYYDGPGFSLQTIWFMDEVK